MRLGFACLLAASALACAGGLVQAGEGRDPAIGQGPCAVPVDTITTEAPLPRVAEAIRAGKRLRVLAIGSSSTEGVGASTPIAAYPAVLEGIFRKTVAGVEVKITNRGISGEVASQTAARMPREIAVARPDLVLWQVGTNDALRDVPPEAFAATVRDTIRAIRAEGIDVALVGLQYTSRLAKDERYLAIRAVIKNVARDENVLYVRRYEAMQQMLAARPNENLLAADQFHLNDLGYRCMAEHVAMAIGVNLFHRYKLMLNASLLGTPTR